MSPQQTKSEALSLTEDDILNTVQHLKQERDTWRAVALQYQAAFEAETVRLRELQNICVATQAELENEKRIANRQSHSASETLHKGTVSSFDGARDSREALSFGTATLIESPKWTPNTNNFRQAEQLAEKGEYVNARDAIGRLLHKSGGSLDSHTRVEGLLLKSDIERKAGPDWLLEALATCSLALEACNELEELRTYLPKIQYQRGLCLYQLQDLQAARDAFGAVQGDETLNAKAKMARQSIEDEILAKRRSGFEEHNRAVTDSLLTEFSGKKGFGVRRRTP